MAIAFDAVSNSTASSTTLTMAHTTSGSNRLLVVACDSNESSTSSTIISGVTYNGVSMNLLGSVADSFGYYTYFFYLVAPATGANNIVVTRSSSGGIMATGMSYTDVNQSSPFGATVTNTGGGATMSATLTTLYANSWLVSSGERHRSLTAGANTTLRTTEGVGSLSAWDTNGSQGATGSKTMTANQEGSATNWAIYMAEMREYVAPTGPVNVKTVNGVSAQ